MWAKAHPEPPLINRNAQRAVAIDGRIYITGGWHDALHNPRGELEVYDPATNSVALLTKMPEPRTGFGAVAVRGRMYVVGGLAASPGTTTLTESAALLIYDPTTDTWAYGAPMKTPRGDPGVAVLDGKVIVFGGCRYDPASGQWIALASTELYDPETGTWSDGPNLGNPRAFVGSAVLDGQVYAIGGARFIGATLDAMAVDTVEVYSAAQGEWQLVASLGSPRMGSAGVVLNGRLYAVGGHGDDPTGADPVKVEMYDASAGVWTELSPLPAPYDAPSAVVIGDKIYVVGGPNPIAVGSPP